MALGRTAALRRGGTTLVGIRTLSIEWAGSSINLSSGEDNGYQLLDTMTGEESLTIPFEGVAKDAVIRDLVLNGGSKLDSTFELVFSNGDSITCDFFIGSYSEGMPYNDAITFSSSLASSGQWTYTKAA